MRQPMNEQDAEKLHRKLTEHALRFPLFRLLGVELEDFRPGFARTRLPLRDDLKNANGMMHGGIIATLIDITITQAMLMTDEYQRVRETHGLMTSVDLRIKYLRPLSSGDAICEATIPHLGRRISHANAVVKSAEDKPLAFGDSTILITLGDPQAAPK
jgi:uncharacterized protein (TIGR00369 family)